MDDVVQPNEDVAVLVEVGDLVEYRIVFPRKSARLSK
jgi:hypothetical protein